MGKHLERLGEDRGRVFSIEKLRDGNFKIWEECDSYFSQAFTPEELRELAQEIIDLANSEVK